MELIRGLHNLRPEHKGCVATIGAFDGVHHGHQMVLQHLMDKANEFGCPSVVTVFEPLPREYFSPLDAPARIMSFREKFGALDAMGIDRLLRIRFHEGLRKMRAQQAVEEIFVAGLGVRHVVLGDDWRFGRDREGDLALLQLLGKQHGFTAESADTLKVKGQRVSSTRVRDALGQADFVLAEQLLGRPYSMAGRVVVGRQLGRTLGAPTANLELRRLRAPLSGVYAVQVHGAGPRVAHGVANVGTRPTVEDSVKANLEVHLLDFDDDIYGRTIEVIFHHKLRDEKKFESVDVLKQQIKQDQERGRAYFGLSK